MFELCRHHNNYIIDNLKNIDINEAKPCMSNIVDDIILAMHNIGVLKYLDNGFDDRRKPNKTIPFDLIITLAVAAKMKCNTSLTDIPYALQSHKTLPKLSYNIVDNTKMKCRNNSSEENMNLAMTEGSLRHLISNYNANDFVNYYNDTLLNHIMPELDITPTIHIGDVTKIKVNMLNENFENSGISFDKNTNTYYRGYKLSALRGIVEDGGIIEEIRFGNAEKHDLNLSEDMLKNSPHFHEGDILIMDRGYLSRDLVNYLKNIRKIDIYIPLKKNMTAYEEAVKIAKKKKITEWEKHPNKKRKEQLITLVTELGDFWESKNRDDDVDFNACVVWHTDKEDEYSVFISTDTSKNAKQIVSTYEMRTEIEEGFRQAKDFWKLEDFKSTKENFIVFHVICTLMAYLFYLLYCLIIDEGKNILEGHFQY